MYFLDYVLLINTVMSLSEHEINCLVKS